MNFWMWRPDSHPLSNLEQQMNQLFNMTMNLVGRQLFQTDQPFLQSNLYETAQDYFFLMPLPGVDANQIELQIAGNHLMIKGDRRRPDHIADEAYRRQERWMGRWQRSIPLPPRADVAHISASLENGILLIRLPKQPEPQPHVLPIKVRQTHAGPTTITAEGPAFDERNGAS